MPRATAEPVAIAVLAKAPLPGLAKTRLIPALGADGAAMLAARLIERAIATAQTAALGPVTLWCAPDESHPVFAAMPQKYGVALARQPDGDLGARMHEAAVAANRPALVIGSDCPALTAAHLREAADALRDHDAVLIPAEDGGYVLIGLRGPQSGLFSDMEWSTAMVMDETRRRMQALALSCRELTPLWDVDSPADLARLQGSRFGA
jgi:rSAM/selenodomain-associated transferase 1